MSEPTISYREYHDVFTAAGMPDIFPPHLLKFWLTGIPAEYAAASLRALGDVRLVHEYWAQGIPLEYAVAGAWQRSPRPLDGCPRSGVG